jgi:5'-3' exonuclease
VPTRLLLDGPSLVYRAFYAVPKDIKDKKGRSVNAARGFLDMLATMITVWKPDDLIVALDADWRPAFRVEAYAGYKSERPEDPEELPWQFDLIDELLQAFGIAQASVEGLEADDTIATLVQNLPENQKVYIVSGDRDLLALVRDPNVRLLFPVKGVREMADFDEAGVEAKYGVPPRLYPDFATLRGDGSDGLPGVPGIGPVRAVKLLKEFGSIDGLMERLDELPIKQRLVFKESRGYLEAMKTVVGLVRDADVELTEAGPPDVDLTRKLGERYNLRGPVERLLLSLGVPVATGEEPA